MLANANAAYCGTGKMFERIVVYLFVTRTLIWGATWLQTCMLLKGVRSKMEIISPEFGGVHRHADMPTPRTSCMVRDDRKRFSFLFRLWNSINQGAAMQATIPARL